MYRNTQFHSSHKSKANHLFQQKKWAIGNNTVNITLLGNYAIVIYFIQFYS